MYSKEVTDMTYWVIVPVFINVKTEPTLVVYQERKPRWGTRTVKYRWAGVIHGFDNAESAMQYMDVIGVPNEMRPAEYRRG